MNVLTRVRAYLSADSYVVGVVLLATYVFLYGLGYAPLVTWDEAIYASVARLMAHEGFWTIPQLYFHPQTSVVELQPFLETPPLVFWLQGASVAVFGATRFAVRLPVALFAVLTAVLVFHVGTHLYDRVAGFVAAIVFVTTPLVFAGSHGGRSGSTDIPLVFFGSLFVYLTWRSLSEERTDLLPYVGLAAGLAVLTKGFASGVFVLVVLPLVVSKWRVFLTKQTATMVGVVAALILPWATYAWVRYREEFVYQLFLQQVVGRATGTEFTATEGTLFAFMRYPYVRTLPAAFDPWIFLLLPAVAVACYRGWRRDAVETPLGLC